MVRSRLDKLRARRIDPMIRTAGMNEFYARIQETDAVKYAIGAMQPIDSEYTRHTFEQSDRVQNQLKKNLSVSVEFEHQGSATNDTHIKAHSDIDLLTVHTGFETLEHPQQPNSPYHGNPVDELVALRNASIRILRDKFPEATVDSTGSKAVNISGGSLSRKVDVVACNWFNTNKYAETSRTIFRGINVLDTSGPKRIKNLPFLHNHNIDVKDCNCIGNVRKGIRLLKSLSYDSDNDLGISSYDICALVYNMPEEALFLTKGQELQLVNTVHSFFRELLDNQTKREVLWVPNGTRKVFCEEGTKRTGLKNLYDELDKLLFDINNDMQRSFRKLAEARVDY